MKKKVDVEIFGEIYSLKTDEDSEYVRKVAAAVDSSMREIAQKTHSFSSARLSVFAALDLADKYFQMKKDYEELLKLVDSKNRHK